MSNSILWHSVLFGPVHRTSLVVENSATGNISGSRIVSALSSSAWCWNSLYYTLIHHRKDTCFCFSTQVLTLTTMKVLSFLEQDTTFPSSAITKSTSFPWFRTRFCSNFHLNCVNLMVIKLTDTLFFKYYYLLNYKG